MINAWFLTYYYYLFIKSNFNNIFEKKFGHPWFCRSNFNLSASLLALLALWTHYNVLFTPQVMLEK